MCLLNCYSRGLVGGLNTVRGWLILGTKGVLKPFESAPDCSNSLGVSGEDSTDMSFLCYDGSVHRTVGVWGGTDIGGMRQVCFTYTSTPGSTFGLVQSPKWCTSSKHILLLYRPPLHYLSPPLINIRIVELCSLSPRPKLATGIAPSMITAPARVSIRYQ